MFGYHEAVESHVSSQGIKQHLLHPVEKVPLPFCAQAPHWLSGVRPLKSDGCILKLLIVWTTALLAVQRFS